MNTAAGHVLVLVVILVQVFLTSIVFRGTKATPRRQGFFVGGAWHPSLCFAGFSFSLRDYDFFQECLFKGVHDDAVRVNE